MKVEVDVLGSRPYETYGFCGRKATLQPGDTAFTLTSVSEGPTDLFGSLWISSTTDKQRRRGRTAEA